jgi:hypothetical protein
MEPKPLFPNKVTTMAQPNKPKQVFKSAPARTMPTPAPKPSPVVDDPTKSVMTNEEHLRLEEQRRMVREELQKRMELERAPKSPIPIPIPIPKPAPKGTAGKVLFPSKAVGVDVVDPFYRDHPLCVKLSHKDIARVRNIVDAADIADASYVLHYSDEQRVRFGTLIDGIIKEQTSGKTSQVNDKIQDLLITMEASKELTTILTTPQESGLMRWIRQGAYVPSVNEVVQKFQNNINRVDVLVVELKSSVSELLKLIDSFDDVFKNNRDNFTLLNLHVIAGKIITERHLTKTLPEMEKTVDTTNIFAGQDLAYFRDSVTRFERKVTELEKLAHSVILNAPAIRMLQMASKDKADRIQQISQTVVPTWKQQCVVLMSALETSSASKIADLQMDKQFIRKKGVLAEIEQSFTSLKQILA